MMILGLTSASFSCTHFHEVELFQAFLSAVHSLVWLLGPSPQYSRLMPQPECLRRSYMVVPPVLGMCTKYSKPHSMSTAHLHTDCAVLGQPLAHVVVHQSSVAMALMAAYPCLQTSAPSAVGATEASATLVGTGDGDANGGDDNGAGDGVGGGGGRGREGRRHRRADRLDRLQPADRREAELRLRRGPGTLAEEVARKGGRVVLSDARLGDAAVGGLAPLGEASVVGMVGGVDIVHGRRLLGGVVVVAVSDLP